MAGGVRPPVSSGRGAPDHYGHLDTHLSLIDLSLHPKTNKRISKLGGYTQTMGVAVYDFNPETQRVFLADGLNASRSIFPFEFDNWKLRYHDKGTKLDKVWSIALLSDHEETHAKGEHRSTIVIDNCTEQTWAYLADLAWIISTEAKVDDKRARLNKAGVPSFLGGGALETRGALAQNISKKGGYLSDGVRFAQLWHLVTYCGLSGAAGSTVAAQCAPTTKDELGLRADVTFISKTDKYHFTPLPNGPTPTFGTIAVGYMYIYPNDPPVPDAPDVADDSKSNQPILPKKKYKSTKCFVYVPIMTPTIPPKTQYPPWSGTPSKFGGGLPPVPTGETSGTSALPPTATGGGPGTVAEIFYPGDFTGFYCKWPIPETLVANFKLELLMQFSPSAAYAALQSSDFSFLRRAYADAATPGAYTQTDKSFSSADGLSSSSWKKGKFTIPYSELQGKEGGTVEFWVFMKSSSTGPAMRFAEIHAQFVQDTTGGTAGFALT